MTGSTATLVPLMVKDVIAPAPLCTVPVTVTTAGSAPTIVSARCGEVTAMPGRQLNETTTVRPQPVTGSQKSAVQALPSSHCELWSA